MDQNQKLSLKMAGLIALGGIVALPVVGLWLYDMKERAFMGASDRYGAKVPATPTVRVKDVAAYCTPGVQKRTITCN